MLYPCITDFQHIMDQHTTLLADTVSLDLTYFSNKLIECGFITQTAANGVLSKLGVTAGYKSQELLHLARQNYEISLKKQEWADKFIGIFSSQAAYSDLAARLRGDSSHTGMPDICSSGAVCSIKGAAQAWATLIICWYRVMVLGLSACLSVCLSVCDL